MKGIVFNLLEDAVTNEFGADTWDDLLDAADLRGAYTSLGSYDDADMGRLVSVAAAALTMSPEDVLRWFGRRAMPLLAGHYPFFFSPHRRTRDFLLTLNDIIHPEVRKLYPGAATPAFDFEPGRDDSELRIGYRSERRLCALAGGFIAGAADHYGERVHEEHPMCMLRGDAKCLFVLRLSADEVAPTP